jgi:hypothetical protein
LALLCIVAHVILKYWQAVVESWLFREFWWHTYSIRQGIQYSMVTQLTWLVVLEIFGFAGFALACLRELCSACKRQQSGARFRASLARKGQKTVEWNDHSVWTPDASLSYEQVSETVQRDQAGITWCKAMSGKRSLVPIFNAAETPPQSRFPTPQTIAASDHSHDD